MSPLLAALEKLQAVDLELDTLGAHAGDATKKVAEAEAALAKARAAADGERGKVADAERERTRLEHQLADDKERLKKWDGRIVQAKHQKDFTALQREAEGLRKSIATVEEALNAQKKSVEDSRVALKTRDADVTAREAEVEAAKSGAVKAQGDGAARINELKAERETAKAAVDARTLGQYESIRKKKPGKVLVPVVNGSCTGCNKKISPAINQRLMFTGAVEVCPCAGKLIFARLTPPPAT